MTIHKDNDAVHSEAHTLEGYAKEGSADAAAKLLNEMAPAERIAIARQIMQDEKSDPSLPNMTFDNKGDLTGVDRTNKDGASVHSRYDPTNGNVKSIDTDDHHGFSTHTEYDSKTRKFVFEDMRLPDGSKQHMQYDPAVKGLKITKTQ